MKSVFLLAGLSLLLLLAAPAYSSPANFVGKTITRIDIRDGQGNPWPEPEQLLPLIAIKPGSKYSGAAIRDSLSLLYLKGLFKDIRVEAFPDNTGVRLEYRVFPITVVDKIVVRGNHALSTINIREAVQSMDGKELREEKLPLFRADILALYQAEGFYDATVTFRTEPLKEPFRVALVVYITEASPTLIEELTFSGNTTITDKELFFVMKNKMGLRLNRDLLLDSDMASIIKKYTAAGYPAAKTGQVDIRFSDNKAFVHIQVTEGPKVVVLFKGNREFSSSTLGRAILIWSERDISNAVIDSSADKIITLYREKGYADVTVEVRRTETLGRLDLEFAVHEGPRRSVSRLVLSGNTAFSTSEIKDQMALRESGWFTSPPFREDLLEKDIENLHDRYLNAGYLSTGIEKSVLVSSDRSTARVELVITEGPQTRTGGISFEGNRFFSTEELVAMVNLKQGMLYNELTVDEDRYRVLTAYSNKGYLYARVDVDKTLGNGVVDVRYRITEDLPVRIGTIILRGNKSTKDYVIMRELLVKTGDAYDYAAILSSQQQIYHLGYFRVARFEPLRQGEKEYIKDMLFIVDERPAGAMEYTVGYGDLDRLRGSVEVYHRNLWGTARYSSLRFEQSDILKRAIFNFQEPWLLNRKLEGKFSLVWSDSEKLNSDTREIYYKTRKTTASFGIEKTFQRLTPSLTYMFENIRNYDVRTEAELTAEDSGRVLVSSLSPALIWDLRDDVFNPRRGALYGILLKEALKELLSEADFSKLTVQGSWFLPIKTAVVALSARAGIAWPFRNTSEVPIHERFYVGGSTTVRGYTQDSIGPSALDSNGDAIPQGGQSMAVFNIELRLNPGEGLGYVLFTDAGNVWPGQKIELTDIRSSYGVGIRYATPVGPLRIDYGQKIHRLPGESPGEIHFNIGNTF